MGARGIQLMAVAILTVSALLASQPAMAQSAPSELYRVTTLRAAPGKLLELIDHLKARRAEGAYRAAGREPPMIMRHSQGDQWDLLLLQPAASYAAYFNTAASRRSRDIDALAVFREDLFALGPPADAVREAFDDNAFFHIEMFAALAGRHQALFEQRRAENEYLAATGRTTNFIWLGDTGSDIDVFTIGFYPSLAAFAAPSPATPEERDQAARDAGFEGRDRIGFYLRNLIAAHHDTLATKVE